MKKQVRTLERRFTYGDYLTWPEDERWELIDGIAYDMTPAPSRLHSDISNALERMLWMYFEGKPCQLYHAPFDVRLSKGGEPDDEVDTVVQPDILVVCDRKKLDDKGCRGAPDFVIEILSPSNASKDAIKKRDLYEKHGVKEFWLVDPSHRMVTAYSLKANGDFGKPELCCDEDKVKIKIFPGLEIDLAKIFPFQPKIVREGPRKYFVG